MNEKHQFIIPAVILAVVVSIVGGFFVTQAQVAWLRPASQGQPSLSTDGRAEIAGGAILNAANPPATNGLIVQSGKVGIGDLSPSALLTVGSGDLFQVTSSGYARGPDGSDSAPTFSFTGDTNTGMYTTGSNSNTIAFSTAGLKRAIISDNGRLVVYDTLNTLASVDTDGNWVWTNVVNYSSGVQAGPITPGWQNVMLSNTKSVLGIKLSGSSDDGGKCLVNIFGYFTGAVTNNGYITDLDIDGSNGGQYATSNDGPMATRTFLFSDLSGGRALGQQFAVDNDAYNKALGLTYIPPGKTLRYSVYAADGAASEYVNCIVDVLYGNAY